MPAPSRRRLDVLGALKRHLDQHGEMPTAEELASAVGRKSPSAVREDLGWLVVHGYIRDDPNQPGHIWIAPEVVIS